MDLKNRVVLVTGSSSGIGKKTALLFSQKGCNVVITYNKEKESGLAVCKACRSHGDAILIHLDVRDDASITDAVKAVVGKWGRIDILVNNAGVVVGNLFINQSKEDIENQVNVNLLGLMKITRAFLPRFYEQEEGIIINIGSTAGAHILPGVSVYSAVKAGLDAFTAALAQELPGGIRIYTVYPGTTATRMTGFGGKEPEKVAEIIVQTAEETLGINSGGKIYVEKFLSEMVKASYYNVFFPFDEKVILFNTRRGSIFVVDSTVKDALEKGDIYLLERKLMEPFRDTGVLVQEDMDEKDSIVHSYAASREDTLSTAVHIIPTYQCNLMCADCYVKTEKSMDEKGVLCTVQFIKDLVKENKSNTLTVDLFGGEPLLNMAATLLIARKLRTWCEETGTAFSFSMNTNGTLVPETIEEVAEYTCSILTTLEGPKKIHDKRRLYKNGKGTFDDIIQGLQCALDYGVTTAIKIRVDKANKDYIVDLLAFLRDNNLHRVRTSLNLMRMTPPFCGWNTYCVPDEAVSLIDFELFAAAKAMNVNIVQPDELSLRGVCSAQRPSYFTVDPFLRLYKCAVLPPVKEYAVGALSPGASSPEFNQLNRDFLSRNPLELEGCKTCKGLPVCGGGCAALALKIFGTPHEKVCKKAAFCTMLQNSLLAAVKGRG